MYIEIALVIKKIFLMMKKYVFPHVQVRKKFNERNVSILLTKKFSKLISRVGIANPKPVTI